MSESLIKDLYTNFVDSSESPHLCYLLYERIDTTTAELKSVLYKENRKKLERLCQDYEKINLMETDRAFVDGFSFAVKLMAEAFANK